MYCCEDCVVLWPCIVACTCSESVSTDQAGLPTLPLIIVGKLHKAKVT